MTGRYLLLAALLGVSVVLGGLSGCGTAPSGGGARTGDSDPTLGGGESEAGEPAPGGGATASDSAEGTTPPECAPELAAQTPWLVVAGEADEPDTWVFATSFPSGVNILATNAHVVVGIQQACQGRRPAAIAIQHGSGEVARITSVCPHPLYDPAASEIGHTPDVGLLMVDGHVDCPLRLAPDDKLEAVQVFDEISYCGFHRETILEFFPPELPDLDLIEPGMVVPIATCHQGTLAAIRPCDNSAEDPTVCQVLEYDMPATPGTSGSAVCDADYDLIGVHAFGFTTTDLNRAFRADLLLDLVNHPCEWLPDGVNAGPECADDGDCADLDPCTDGLCVGGRCEFSPRACPAGQTCDPATGLCEADDWCEREGRYDNGVCDADCPKPDPDCEADPVECSDNDDCDADEVCSAGQCVSPPTGPACDTVADCEDGDRCTLDSCVSGSCWRGYISCGPGETCDPSTGQCEAEDWCEGQGKYGDGVCDPDCPKPDPDCPIVPPPECRSDAECPPGWRCVHGVCVGEEDSIIIVGCVAHSDCDNLLFCDGVETCVDDFCEAGPPPCPASQFCDETEDICRECWDDYECSDGVYCNGFEVCAGGACVAGTPPCGVDEVCVEDGDRCDSAPVAHDQRLLIEQDSTEYAITLVATDDDSYVLTYTVVTSPSHGTLTGTGDGDDVVYYTPDTGFTGEDSFTFRAGDEHSQSGTATVSISVRSGWETIAQPPAHPSGLQLVVAANALYLIGGAGCYQYDEAGDAWLEKAAPPTARTTLAAAVLDGQVYAIGGGTGPDGADPVATVERYNPGADAWTAVASLTRARSRVGAAVSGGRIYVFGGCDVDGTYLRTIEVYDPAAGTWTLSDDMLPDEGAVQGTEAVVAGGSIYVFAGRPYSRPHLWRFDPAAAAGSRWTTLAEPPYVSSYTAWKPNVCAVGPFLTHMPKVIYGDPALQLFDPEAGQWSVSIPPLDTHADGASASLTGYLYVVGGEAAAYAERLYVGE